jgi:hypothetical protein
MPAFGAINTIMYIKLFFSQSNFILIKLKNHPAIVKWFNYFSIATKQITDFHNCHIDIYPIKPQPHTPDLDLHWNLILEAVTRLRVLGYNFPYTLSSTFDYSQHTLNLLHRFFAYNALWARDVTAEPNPFDPAFLFPEHMTTTEWYALIDIINMNVHRLEKYVSTPHKQFLIDNNHIINSITLVSTFPNRSFADPSLPNYWLPFTEQEQLLNHTSMDFALGPAVMLDNAILGKSILKSFFEHDDPTAKDCTGRLGSFGGFTIDLDQTRQRIHNTPEFQTWTDSHGVSIETLPLDFQIGNLVDTSFANLNMHAIRAHEFQRLEFQDTI